MDSHGRAYVVGYSIPVLVEECWEVVDHIPLVSLGQTLLILLCSDALELDFLADP